MSNDYLQNKNKNNFIKLQRLIKELPDFCSKLFLSIEQNTTLLTRVNYANDLKIFFYFLVNEIEYFKNKSVFEIKVWDLNSINSSDIEYFMQFLSHYSLYGKNYSNSEKGKARKLSSVRSLFRYLFNNNLIYANNIEKVRSPKIHEKEIVRLEIDEVVKLLNEAEFGDKLTEGQKRFHNKLQKRDVAILTLFLGTGIRISECVGINVDDINFENNSFKILRKGGNEAILYFSDEVSIALSEYIEERQEFLGKKADSEKALFISIQKRRVSVRAVQNLVKKYSSIISPLKNITPHKLRSTYGTALYRETKDIYVVADVLGHKDVNTTKKHYAAISEDIRRDAANKVKLR